MDHLGPAHAGCIDTSRSSLSTRRAWRPGRMGNAPVHAQIGRPAGRSGRRIRAIEGPKPSARAPCDHAPGIEWHRPRCAGPLPVRHGENRAEAGGLYCRSLALGGLSSIGRAADCGSAGYGFDSRRPPHQLALSRARLPQGLASGSDVRGARDPVQRRGEDLSGRPPGLVSRRAYRPWPTSSGSSYHETRSPTLARSFQREDLPAESIAPRSAPIWATTSNFAGRPNSSSPGWRLPVK